MSVGLARIDAVPTEPCPTSTDDELNVRLPFRPPLDAAALFGFLRARAVGGVEDAGAEHYSRALRLAHGAGTVTLRPRRDHVAATLRLADQRDRDSAIAHSRRLLDLDADPAAVAEVLDGDPALAPMLRKHPGVRVPGSVDGAEIVVRAVLGQQVSVAAARTAAQRLTEALGEPLTCAGGTITRLFPTPAAIASGVTGVLTGPKRRTEALRLVCEALADGSLLVEPGRDADELSAQLRTFPGIGPWTANYVALRVLGAADVLLDGDLAMRRGAAELGLPDRPGALRAHAQRWRPWRSYAGMLLWLANQRPI